MKAPRSSGILLHPTSLPGTPGIGTIGSPAYHFIDWLSLAGQSLWQVLPLGPTGYGDSPYASFSTFAGNPLLIDLQMLQDQGLLSAQDTQLPEYIRTTGPIDFGSVVWWKIPLLKKAAAHFLSTQAGSDYNQFIKEQAYWLDDYALFMNIKAFYDKKAQDEGLSGKLWHNWWPRALATRDKKALVQWKEENKAGIEEEKAIQYLFYGQWKALKQYAHSKGISIIGDIPIFVAADSADVWANQKYFQLTDTGSPKAVAGVPPDYFSETGQLWGNPLYNWKALKKDGYSWWLKRITATLSMVDYVRVDHFRGFEAYWSVPAEEATAINGQWIQGPDHDFFKTIRASLGELPILAEDLGVITDGVRALRDDFGFPGMKVLQFAFDANEAGQNGFTNAFLPHMYTANSIVYTGTHDNDTMKGWLDKADIREIDMIKDYLGVEGTDLVRDLIRAALMSVAVFAIFPLQDIYGIGSEGRMNEPSTLGSNWTWRMDESMYNPDQASWLKRLSRLYARNLEQA